MIQYSVVIQFVNMCIYMHMERDRLSPEELLENLPCKTLLKFHDLAVFLNSCGCRRCRVKAKGSGCYGSDHFRTEGLDACGFVGRRRIPMWVVVKIIFPVWVPTFDNYPCGASTGFGTALCRRMFNAQALPKAS